LTPSGLWHAFVMLPEAVRQEQHHLIQPLELAWQKA